MSLRFWDRLLNRITQITRPILRHSRPIFIQRSAHCRLALEVLEDRTAPATITWTNASGGDWDTGSNWSTGSVPGAGDDAVINQTGINITHSTNVSDSVNSIQCSATLNISSGSLSIANTSSISALTESGGTLTGAGDVTVTGALTWTGGTMSGTGTTTSSGMLQLGANDNSTHQELLNGRTLDNTGTGNWLGIFGYFDQQYGSTFDNEAGGTFTIQTTLPWYSSTDSTFTNAGTLIENPGSGTTPIDAPFNDTGTVTVETGELSLDGGGSASGTFAMDAGATLEPQTYTLASGFTDSGPGTFLVDQGTLTVAANVSVATVTMTGGTLTGDGTLTVTGTLTWTGGIMSGTGTTTSAGTLQLGANDNSTHQEFLNGRTLDNTGTGNWLGTSGYFDQQYGSTFDNEAGGAFTIQNTLTWYSSTNSTFTNAGTLIENPGSGTTPIDAPFNDTGTVTVETGELSLDGGGSASGTFAMDSGATLEPQTYTLESGFTDSGAGSFLVDKGTLTVAANVSVATLTVTGGTLTGAGTLTVTGTLTWTGGTMSGTGTTTSAGMLQLGDNSGGDYETLNGRTFNNAGSATWQGPSYFQQQNGSTFDNEVGGTFTIQADAQNWYSSTNSTFINAGTLIENPGSGTTTIDAPFNDTGRVRVETGELSLDGGGSASGTFAMDSGATLEPQTYTLESGFTDSGTGSFLVDKGTLTVAANVSVATLTMTGGTLTGDGTLTVTGTLAWTGGTMSGTGTTTSAGTLQLGAVENSGLQILNGRTMNNTGSATWVGGSGYFDQQNGSTFDNEAGGTFTIQTTLTWYSSTDSTFTNAGTLIENPGSGTTTINAVFSNTGILQVQSGTLALPNGSVNVITSGLLASEAGTTISISGSLLGNTQEATLFNPQGTVLFNRSSTTISPLQLEVMSQDLGNIAAGFSNNFDYGTIALGNDTTVQLVNQVQNSPGIAPEALYVNNLIVPEGSTLDLNGFAVYAKAVQIDGNVIGGQINQSTPGGSVNINSSTSGTINSAYPTNTWTFFARANQAVSVVVNPGDANNPPSPLQPTLGYAQVQILDSNGNVLATGTSSVAGGDVDLLGVSLPADGIYSVVVSPPTSYAASTGNYTIGIYNATTTNNVLSLGQNVTGQLYTGYEIDNYTFTGLANDQMQFNLINEANPGIQFDMTGPNGFTAFSDANASSGLITLPSNGTYTLTVHSTTGQTGAYAFDLAETTQNPLTLGTTYQGTLLGSGQAELFTVNVPQAGSQLLVNLADTNRGDQDELYLSLGSAPTRISYQYRYSNLASADQQILVPAAAPGKWYILLYGNDVSGPSAYSLTASSASVVVSNVTSNEYGTSQDAHLTLNGAGFNTSTMVSLIAANGTSYPASAVQDNSPTQVSATFTANSVPAGTYSIEVVNPGSGSGTLPNAITMVQGGQANLVTNLILPNPMGRHIASVIYVQYSNTGNIAMPAPMLVLTGTNPMGQQGALMTLNKAQQNSGFWTSALPYGYSTSVQFLGSGATPGVLEPGESETVPVYYSGWIETQWDFNDPHLYFTVKVITSSSPAPVGWNTAGLQASLQPPGMPAKSWAAIYSNLTSQIGPTWGDYVQRLDQDASYLGSLGENVTALTQLWSFEVQQANGFNSLMDLSTATDMTVQVPGLSLSISRSFSSELLARDLLGPFGYGWVLAGGWGQTLAPGSDGSVAITSAYGSQSIYQPDTQFAGTYFAQPGNDNKLANPAGGVYTLTAPDGQVTEFVNGVVAFIQDSEGNRITTGYTNGLLTSLTDSSGAWIDFTYNSAGRITSTTNSEGQTTTYLYDPTNQYLLSVTQYNSAADTVGSTTSYTYSNSTNPVLANALLSVANPDGSQRNFSYDAEGRLSETSANGGAQVVQYAYGIGGTVSATTATSADGDGGTTTYYYDYNGLLLKLVDPLGNKTEYSYDSTGNLTQVTDPAGQIYSYQYDSNGNITQSIDPLGDVAKFTYGFLDTLTSATDPNGNTTQYQHDPHGDLTATIYADGSVETNAYNPIGQLLQTTDADGNVTDYTYNPAGQILSETYSDGTQTTFTYDSYGNLVSATNGTGTTTLTYDSANRLIEILYPNGTYLKYTYNAAGQRETMTDQTGYTLDYSYNALGQLAGLNDASGSIVSYTYDASGHLSEEVKGNGSYTQYTYDAAGDILSLVNYAPGGTVNSSFGYTYNDLGLCATETTIDGQWVYTYDAVGQLTQAVFTPNNSDPDGIPGQNLQYFYDANGNRTESITNGVVTTYTVNDRNQYTSTTTIGVGTTTYSYDANGNLITEVAPTGTTAYTFNLNNQVIGIQAPGGITSSYQYDPFGNLYAATQNGQQTDNLVDPLDGSLVGQFTTNGTTLAQYTYGLGLVSQINPVGAPSYYDFDALGSTAGLTNSAGSYVNSYSYIPFGGTIGTSGEIANSFQFIGQWEVSSVTSDLDLMGARIVSVSLGRFLSQDPLGIIGSGTNDYTYVENSPTNLIDPLGLGPGASGFGAALGNYTAAVNNLFKKSLEDSICELQNALAAIGQTAEPAAGELVPFLGGGVRGSNGRYPGVEYFRGVFEFALDLYQGGQAGKSGGSMAGGMSGTACGGGGGGESGGPGGGGAAGGGSGGTASGATVVDPNALYGPAGYGSVNFISTNTAFPYRIDYENSPTATAPVQRVTITDQLDPNLNWSTFQLTGLGFGSTVINVPANTQNYQTSVSMTYNGETFNVDLIVYLNPVTGLLTVIFQAIEPGTDLPPANALTGFLPPEDGTGRGEGYVSFLIDPKSTLPTGARITNVALITFDGNPAIATDQVNDEDPTQGIDPTKEAPVTIDSGAPTSSVTALPTFSPTTFTVNWTGQDNPGGSGVATYEVYDSEDGGSYTLWQPPTASTSALFTGQDGHTYSFYSIATDNVGNVQTTPTTAQAQTTTPGSQYAVSETENGASKPVSVSTVLGSNYSDPDGSKNTNPGIAVIDLTGNGIWQYSTNGSSWTTITTVSQSSALLLPASDSLRFVPAANTSGPADLLFLAWDSSQGKAGSFFNATNTGGTTPFSSNDGSVVVTVHPVPLWVGSNAELTSVLPGTYSVTNTTTPAGNTVASIFGASFHDDNAAVSVGVAVSGLTGTGNGTWQYSLNSGLTWTTLPTVSATSALLLAENDLLRFVPKSGFVGVATLTALAWDGSIGTHGTLINPSKASSSAFSSTTLTCSAAVNTAPTLAGLGSTLSAIPGGNSSAPATLTSLLTSADYADPDGKKLAQGVAVIGISGDSVGNWQFMLAGGSWQVLPTTVSLSSALLLPSTAALRFVSTNLIGSATLMYLGWDQTQGSAGKTFDIASQGGASAFSTASATTSITVRQSPSWSASTGAHFTSILPGTSSPAGNTAASVFGGFFQDANSSATVGIAVVGLNGTANGAWQYSTNDGTSWNNLSATISAKTALLLSSNDLLRFVPKSGFAGVVTLTALAWDTITGSDGGTVNLSSSGSTGGTTAFSATTLAATYAVNNAPILSSNGPTLATIAEQATSSAVPVTSLLTSASYSDLDGRKLVQGVAVTGMTTPSAGTWQFMLSGGSWQAVPTTVSLTSALLLPSAAVVRFMSTNQIGSATLTFLGWDQTQGLAGKTFDIANQGGASAFSTTSATASITVQQAPSWSAKSGASFTSILPGTNSPAGDSVGSVFGNFFQDANLSTTVGIAVVGLTGTANGGWQYSTNAGTSWNNFSATISTKTALLLSADDLLRFVTKSSFAGVVTLTALAWDGSTGSDGGNVNLTNSGSIGGTTAFSATTLVATFAVNTAPSLSTTVVTLAAVNENVTSPIVTASTLLTKAGWSDANGKTVASGIAIIGEAGPGTWQFFNGSTWSALPTTLSSSLALLLTNTAQLRFMPSNNLPANTNGTATLTFLAWDQTQGTSGKTFALTATGSATAFSATAATASMAVNYVKQAPTWTSGVTASFTPVLGYSASNPTPNPAGDSVESIFGPAFNDAATGTTVGIAVVGLTGTVDGVWQYDNGNGWMNFPTTVGASSNGNALLLSGGDLIRFVPSKAFSGTVSLTVRAWDGSTGTDGGTLPFSKLSTGGGNAFSSTTLTGYCLVNSAPVLNSGGS